MPSILGAVVIGFLIVVAITAVASSSAPHKYHFAAQILLCAAGVLAASIVASLVLFQSTWPDGPEDSHWLVLIKCAGIGALASVPFVGFALLVELHRRSRR